MKIFSPRVSSALCRPEQFCWHVGPGMLFEMATDYWLTRRGTNYLLCIAKWLAIGLCCWSVYLDVFFTCGRLQIFAVIGMRVASDEKVCVVIIQIGKYGMERYDRKKIYIIT